MRRRGNRVPSEDVTLPWLRSAERPGWKFSLRRRPAESFGGDGFMLDPRTGALIRPAPTLPSNPDGDPSKAASDAAIFLQKQGVPASSPRMWVYDLTGSSVAVNVSATAVSATMDGLVRDAAASHGVAAIRTALPADGSVVYVFTTSPRMVLAQARMSGLSASWLG